MWIWLWPTDFQNVLVFQRGCKRCEGAKIPLSSHPFIIYDYTEKLEGNVSQQRFLLTLGRWLGYKTVNLKQRTLRNCPIPWTQPSTVKSSWVNPVGSSACSQGICPHPTPQRKQAGWTKFSFRSPSLSLVNTVWGSHGLANRTCLCSSSMFHSLLTFRVATDKWYPQTHSSSHLLSYPPFFPCLSPFLSKNWFGNHHSIICRIKKL